METAADKRNGKNRMYALSKESLLPLLSMTLILQGILPSVAPKYDSIKGLYMSLGRLNKTNTAVLLSENIFMRLRIMIGINTRESIMLAHILIQNPAGRE